MTTRRIRGARRRGVAGREVSRFAVVGSAVAGISLGGFLLAEALHLPWAATAPPLAAYAAPIAAALGVGVLLADAVLPVPSSLVMVGLGAVFGFGGGAVLALTGRVGGTLAGFAIGRSLAASGSPSDDERASRIHRLGWSVQVPARQAAERNEKPIGVAGTGLQLQ